VLGLLALNANACAAHSTASVSTAALVSTSATTSSSVYGHAALLLSISRHLPLSATTKRLAASRFMWCCCHFKLMACNSLYSLSLCLSLLRFHNSLHKLTIVLQVNFASRQLGKFMIRLLNWFMAISAAPTHQHTHTHTHNR